MFRLDQRDRKTGDWSFTKGEEIGVLKAGQFRWKLVILSRWWRRKFDEWWFNIDDRGYLWKPEVTRKSQAVCLKEWNGSRSKYWDCENKWIKNHCWMLWLASLSVGWVTEKLKPSGSVCKHLCVHVFVCACMLVSICVRSEINVRWLLQSSFNEFLIHILSLNLKLINSVRWADRELQGPIYLCICIPIPEIANVHCYMQLLHGCWDAAQVLMITHFTQLSPQHQL